MLAIGLIVGSTRPNRFSYGVAEWILTGARARDGLRVHLLDLNDAQLPFFDEPMSPYASKGVFSRPEAEAWRRGLADIDAFVATVAEYNHGPTAALKNAFDSAYLEWIRKPIAFVGYGGVGGARAIEQLRTVSNSLQMAPIKSEVSIGMEPFLAVSQGDRSLDDYPFLVQARERLLDDLIWWGETLKRGRAA